MLINSLPAFKPVGVVFLSAVSGQLQLWRDRAWHKGPVLGEGSPGQEQVAAEDTEQSTGPPSVEVQGGQGASSLGHQDQVGPAEAWLGPADGLELPQAHREGPRVPGGAGLCT